MKEQVRKEPSIVAAAERQMQAWALAEEVGDRSVRVDRPKQPSEQPGEPERRSEELGAFITVSREAGACGGQIAELAGQELGWEVLDKKLLDRVADECNLCRTLLECVDETRTHWAGNIFGSWFDPNSIPHDKYVSRLRQVVLAAARCGNVVLVGRGAQFLLPREQGLAVRIIAPEKYRVKQIMRRHGFSPAKARRFIAHVDRGRREFVARFFHRHIDDPHLYDLVINVERVGPVAAAEMIVAAYPRQ